MTVYTNLDRGLFGTPIGRPDYEEILITEGDSAKIERARIWAEAHGFDRLRVVSVDGSIPNFTGAVVRPSSKRRSRP